MLEYILKNVTIPKFIFRLAINLQIQDRLKNEKNNFENSGGSNKVNFINSLKSSPLALSTQTANQQHYEVPTEFYRYILGPRLKYSCCHYQNAKTLQQAEDEMLEMYCQRAHIKNGQSILDLGCGWGSFSLYAAEKFPESKFTAVSNSSTQKEYIDAIANQKRLSNITVITQDINHLQMNQMFDRVISIEMFEHMRNYSHLLSKIAGWTKKDGLIFAHYFCHQYLTYPFSTHNSWMAKNFFQDGIMPSNDILSFFDEHLAIQASWDVNGSHYSKTCYHWLDNLYKHKKSIYKIFESHYSNPKLMYQYWDIFIRACAQLFNFNGGNEWFVAHKLLKKI